MDITSEHRSLVEDARLSINGCFLVGAGRVQNMLQALSSAVLKEREGQRGKSGGGGKVESC